MQDSDQEDSEQVHLCGLRRAVRPNRLGIAKFSFAATCSGRVTLREGISLTLLSNFFTESRTDLGNCMKLCARLHFLKLAEDRSHIGSSVRYLAGNILRLHIS